MALRKESKKEEGSGCNGGSVDTAAQAAARRMKNGVFWCVFDVTADVGGIFESDFFFFFF